MLLRESATKERRRQVVESQSFSCCIQSISIAQFLINCTRAAFEKYLDFVLYQEKELILVSNHNVLPFKVLFFESHHLLLAIRPFPETILKVNFRNNLISLIILFYSVLCPLRPQILFPLRGFFNLENSQKLQRDSLSQNVRNLKLCKLVSAFSYKLPWLIKISISCLIALQNLQSFVKIGDRISFGIITIGENRNEFHCSDFLT